MRSSLNTLWWRAVDRAGVTVEVGAAQAVIWHPPMRLLLRLSPGKPTQLLLAVVGRVQFLAVRKETMARSLGLHQLFLVAAAVAAVTLEIK
jgi:hypothetical protein